MKIYIYCSYQSSPVGFKLGVIQYDLSNGEYYIPSDKDIEPFVQNSFEEGLIKKVYGRIPKIEKYLLLIKKLQGMTIDNISVYMNFAFEFDDVNEFDTFMNNYRNNYSNDEDLAKILVEAIIPDRNIKDFALKINASILNEFVNKLLIKNERSTSSINNVNKNKLIVESRSTSDYSDKIARLFGIDEIFLRKEDKRYIYPEKKKNIQRRVLFGVILISLVLIVVVLIWSRF